MLEHGSLHEDILLYRSCAVNIQENKQTFIYIYIFKLLNKSDFPTVQLISGQLSSTAGVDGTCHDL